MKRFVAAAMAALCWTGACLAAPAGGPEKLTAEQQALLEKYVALQKSLHPQSGDVDVKAAHVTLHLGSDYYFLPADEAKRVLTEAWGNPADSVSETLGMVFPRDKTFLDDTWGAIVTFDGAGFVSDKQATPAELNDLIKQVQDEEPQLNEERRKGGFEPMHLIGWAQPPAYDKASHTVIWAREIQFGDQADHTLNYNLRALGRHGVLSLNMVSEMSKLPAIRPEAEKLRATATFQPGSTFEEFVPGKDKATGYGIAGLVAAGLGLAAAKKLGLLAIVLLFAKKGAVVIAALAAGAVARFRKVFSRKPAPASGAIVTPVREDPPAG